MLHHVLGSERDVKISGRLIGLLDNPTKPWALGTKVQDQDILFSSSFSLADLAHLASKEDPGTEGAQRNPQSKPR